jgi:hypothetical protein
MAGFLLHLLAGHDELGIAEVGHPLFIGVAGHTPIARLVAGVKIEEEQNGGKLGKNKCHARSRSEEFPKFSDGHSEDRIPQNSS